MHKLKFLLINNLQFYTPERKGREKNELITKCKEGKTFLMTRQNCNQRKLNCKREQVFNK